MPFSTIACLTADFGLVAVDFIGCGKGVAACSGVRIVDVNPPPPVPIPKPYGSEEKGTGASPEVCGSEDDELAAALPTARFVVRARASSGDRLSWFDEDDETFRDDWTGTPVAFDVVDGLTGSDPRSKTAGDDAGPSGIEFTVVAGEVLDDDDICCSLNLEIFFGAGPVEDDAICVGIKGARGGD